MLLPDFSSLCWRGCVRTPVWQEGRHCCLRTLPKGFLVGAMAFPTATSLPPLVGAHAYVNRRLMFIARASHFSVMLCVSFLPGYACSGRVTCSDCASNVEEITYALRGQPLSKCDFSKKQRVCNVCHNRLVQPAAARGAVALAHV